MARTRWSEAGIEIDILTGNAIATVIPDVAALRIAVFRDFPYLYDGDLDYERAYLATLVSTPRAVVVVARDGERIIGAATGAPLVDVEDDWSKPFVENELAVEGRFYCAESVLLHDWRGMGIGHAFFDAREDHARTLGMAASCFCSVIRPDDHAAKPRGYRPNDAFWKKRGYREIDGVMARYAWRDIGGDDETEKTLQFWGRAL